MKKIFFVFALLFAYFIASPTTTFAVECCSTPYVYSSSKDICEAVGGHGTPTTESNCTTSQICENNQCVAYQPPPIPTGCSSDSTGRKHCTIVSGPHGSTTIYCSTNKECDEYIADLPKVPTDEFPTCLANNGKEGINTAIGCIPIENSDALIGFILRWAIGVGGGIAFLLIVLAGFQITTSSGNPDKLKAGQELMTSAIAGLILLIFSVFILRIIGVDILGLPGFGQ